MVNIEEIAERHICSNCVEESFLNAEIKKRGNNDMCYYCEEEGNTFPIKKIADMIEIAFERHYEVTDNTPDGYQHMLMKETDYEWRREGERVMYAIASAAGVCEGAAEDIRMVLEDRHEDFERDKMGDEGPFDSDIHYELKGINDVEYRIEWESFEDRLKTANRFFDPTAMSTLDQIYAGLSDYKTHTGRSVIVDAGPCTNLTELYRARVFHADDKLIEALKRPDLELGPPPSLLAVAGRMNAHGVSVFYGAKEPQVALAEIRPPVGSRVVTACFEILKPLRLLDVKALEEVLVNGSIFDYAYRSRLERASFLKRLSRRIAIPVMPGDEPFEYLITQVIADYIANIVGLDGLIYTSAQVEHPSDNVALFHRVSKVKELLIPAGTELDIQLSYNTDYGEEPDYCVWEKLPQETFKQKTKSTELPELLLTQFSTTNDVRSPTLSIKVESVEVRHILGVSFATTIFPVQRHRFSSGIEFPSDRMA